MIETDLVIIGGGPAGMAAAIEAAQHGVTAVLLDENRALGGRVLHEHESGLEPSYTDSIEERTRRELFGAFGKISGKITLLLNAEVWSVNDGKVVEVYLRSGEGGELTTVRGKKLVIAVGAMEKTVPFPGWHLPGVFTVGALNTFVKRRVVPGESILVAGTGPLQIALVHSLVNAGARISALVDAASLGETAALAGRMLAAGALGKLAQGGKYMMGILRHRVPVYRSHAIIRALGTDRVEGAVIAKVDSGWRPIAGTEREMALDTIATGYNLIPQTEITQLCGCRQSYDARLGYWAADRGEGTETTVEGVFVAGDGAGIKGYAAAIDEGRLAALEACTQLGALRPEKATGVLSTLRGRVRKARRIGDALAEHAAPRGGLLENVTGDTVVCRCEEVSYRDIRNAVTEGAKDVSDLKRRTRAGMGHCQGRVCGQMVNELMWRASGEMAERGRFSVRPPLKPVPFGRIAGARS